MDIEYTFKNVPMPFCRLYKCHITNTVDISQGSFIEKLFKILKEQNVNIVQIQTIYYYNEDMKNWIPADEKPPNIEINKLRLKIVMIDKNRKIKNELKNMIAQLKSDINELKKVLEYANSISGNESLDNSQIDPYSNTTDNLKISKSANLVCPLGRSKSYADKLSIENSISTII